MAIRVVVVGMGPRGQDWLREIYADSGYELTGCVDIDPAVLTEVCSKELFKLNNASANSAKRSSESNATR